MQQSDIKRLKCQARAMQRAGGVTYMQALDRVAQDLLPSTFSRGAGTRLARRRSRPARLLSGTVCCLFF